MAAGVAIKSLTAWMMTALIAAVDPEEGLGQPVERDEDDDSGYYSRGGRTHSTFGLDGGTGKRSGGGIGIETGPDGVGHADGDEFLVRVDLVVVDAAESCHPITTSVSGDRDGGGSPTFRNCDMLQQ
jgi:hypothetical protein